MKSADGHVSCKHLKSASCDCWLILYFPWTEWLQLACNLYCLWSCRPLCVWFNMALPMKKSVMKSTKSMKAMKKTTTMKARAMKKKAVSKIARGKMAKAVVFKGTKEKTASGQKKTDLMKTKTGRIVSKAQHAHGKKAYSYISGWTKAVQAARKELGIKGFCAVNGKTAQGKALYAKAKAIYAAWSMWEIGTFSLRGSSRRLMCFNHSFDRPISACTASSAEKLAAYRSLMNRSVRKCFGKTGKDHAVWICLICFLLNPSNSISIQNLSDLSSDAFFFSLCPWNEIVFNLIKWSLRMAMFLANT